jgi:HK97 family phage prohead protease
MKQLETRTVTVDDWELREAGDGMSFTGYAAVFNSPSEPLPFVETIAPGAFSRTLNARNNVRMLLNHNPEKVLASTRGNTLRLMEDGKGLLAEADLPPTTVGRDLSILMQRSIVDSMSFGFTVPRGGDTWNEDGSRRELREVRLIEVSVVTFPAYPQTSASVRMTDVLADRTGEDANALNAALSVLESGGSLTADQAGLLSAVVAKLAPEPEHEPEPEPVNAGPSLDVLRAQLDLALKAI